MGIYNICGCSPFFHQRKVLEKLEWKRGTHRGKSMEEDKAQVYIQRSFFSLLQLKNSVFQHCLQLFFLFPGHFVNVSEHLMKTIFTQWSLTASHLALILFWTHQTSLETQSTALWCWRGKDVMKRVLWSWQAMVFGPGCTDATVRQSDVWIWQMVGEYALWLL